MLLTHEISLSTKALPPIMKSSKRNVLGYKTKFENFSQVSKNYASDLFHINSVDTKLNL